MGQHGLQGTLEQGSQPRHEHGSMSPDDYSLVSRAGRTAHHRAFNISTREHRLEDTLADVMSAVGVMSGHRPRD